MIEYVVVCIIRILYLLHFRLRSLLYNFRIIIQITPLLQYIYEIRLIKETTGDQRQFVEVSVVSSPPSPGYSSAAITYRSGSDVNGNPIDSNGFTIDQTKASPYNITDGVAFLNPCGTTFSTESPAAGTSFLFSSDSTGSTWTFTNNAYVNI